MAMKKVDLKKAEKYLKDAIVLHEKHMNGTEPTDEASQQKMMNMMVKSYEYLTGKKMEMDEMKKSVFSNIFKF